MPFHSEPAESVSAPRNMPTGIQAGHNLVQVPGRFVTSPGAEMGRYRQLMKELDSIRFVEPLRTPTPEPTGRFASAPVNYTGSASKKLTPSL